MKGIIFFRLNCLKLGVCLLIAGLSSALHAATFDVGPGQPLATPSDVPWESLAAGDVVRIHWRAAPYANK